MNALLALKNSLWLEWKIALRFLLDNRLQTLMIAIGIAVGAAVIVFITALVTGLQSNIVEKTIGNQAHIRLSVPDPANTLPSAPPHTTVLVLESKRARTVKTIPNWPLVLSALDLRSDLSVVSPLLSGSAQAIRGQARQAIQLMGIDVARYTRLIPLRSYVRSGSLNLRAGQVVIGSQLAADLGVQSGDKLVLETLPPLAASGTANRASSEAPTTTATHTTVQIAGIVSLGSSELDRTLVYADLKQTQFLLGHPGAVSVLEIRIPHLFDAETLAGQLGRQTGLKAESWMSKNGQLLNALRSQLLSTRMIRGFVALSVALGIASVLAVSVVQRTREVGILRAMGSQRGQILRIFLWQGALLGLLGSLVGATLGLGLVEAFNRFGPKLFVIPVESSLFIEAMLLSTLTGLLAAAIPARRAARLDPATAIRYV